MDVHALRYDHISQSVTELGGVPALFDQRSCPSCLDPGVCLATLGQKWSKGEHVEVAFLEGPNRVVWGADDGFFVNVEAGVYYARQARKFLEFLDDTVVAGVVCRAY